MPVIGPFNRRIVLEVLAVTPDEFGQPIATWVIERTMWAHRRDITANERFRSNQEIAVRTSVFTVRFFPLSPAEHRIVHEGLIWDIEGVAEPPKTRRQYLELTATASGI